MEPSMAASASIRIRAWNMASRTAREGSLPNRSKRGRHAVRGIQVPDILGRVNALRFVGAIQLLHVLFEAAHSIVLRTALRISPAT